MKRSIFIFLVLATALTAGAQVHKGCCWTPDSVVAGSLRDSVKKTIKRFEKQIRKFEVQDSISRPEEGKILFVGSSSIRGWYDLVKDMAPLPVTQRGFGGSTLPEVIHFAPRIIYPYKPKAIVLYCGENDMTLDYSLPEDVLHSFTEIDSLRKIHLPETHLYFISIKPCPTSWYYWPKIQIANKLVKAYIDASPAYLHYIDITPTLLDGNGALIPEDFLKDGIHLSKSAYIKWTAIIKPVLNDFWSDNQ